MVTSGALLDGGAELLWTARRLIPPGSKRRSALTQYIDRKRVWIRVAQRENPHARACDASDAAWARQVLKFVRWHAARAKQGATERALRADLLALCSAFEPLVRRAETLAAIGGGSSTAQTAPRPPRPPRMNVRKQPWRARPSDRA